MISAQTRPAFVARENRIMRQRDRLQKKKAPDRVPSPFQSQVFDCQLELTNNVGANSAGDTAVTCFNARGLAQQTQLFTTATALPNRG